MKKKELMLDFTSLLDVILIILFLVICTMNKTARADTAEIETLTAETAALSEENDRLQTEYEIALTENAELTEEKEKLESEAEGFTGHIQALENEIANLQKSTTFGKDDLMKYETLLENFSQLDIKITGKVSGVCIVEADVDGEFVGYITLYRDEIETEQEKSKVYALISKAIAQIGNKNVILAYYYENKGNMMFSKGAVERCMNDLGSGLQIFSVKLPIYTETNEN